MSGKGAQRKPLQNIVSDGDTTQTVDCPGLATEKGGKTMARVATNGNCYFCGAKMQRNPMLEHLKQELEKDLQEPQDRELEDCFLYYVEGMYHKAYWMYFDLPVTSKLSDLDRFLRDCWVECCGHLSEFSPLAEDRDRYHGPGEYGEFDMKHALNSDEIPDRLNYQYDFGTTTELLVKRIGTCRRPATGEGVRLLARNVPRNYKCVYCGKKAVYFCSYCFSEMPDPAFCEDCAEIHAEDYGHDMFNDITNSPRNGVCGYSGKFDRYGFKVPMRGAPPKIRRSRKSTGTAAN